MKHFKSYELTTESLSSFISSKVNACGREVRDILNHLQCVCVSVCAEALIGIVSTLRP